MPRHNDRAEPIEKTAKEKHDAAKPTPVGMRSGGATGSLFGTDASSRHAADNLPDIAADRQAQLTWPTRAQLARHQPTVSNDEAPVERKNG